VRTAVDAAAGVVVDAAVVGAVVDVAVDVAVVDVAVGEHGGEDSCKQEVALNRVRGGRQMG
jgi:hypothetical protein